MAQGDLPEDGLMGLWLFDDPGYLEYATVGNDLEGDVLENAAPSFNAINGPVAGDGALKIGLGSFYRCFHDIEANGFDPAYPDSIPQRVNQYTLVIDFHKPVNGMWYSFHTGDNNDDPTAGDWESFIHPNGGVGVGSTGYSFYKANDTEGWYRLVIVSDLGVQYKYYLDGQLLQDGGTQSIDNRFSLDSPDGTNVAMFFGDNDGDDGEVDIALCALYERPLTLEEVEAMGGYGHAITMGAPVGEWSFEDETNLLLAAQGADLELVGSHEVIEGPDIGGIAARLGTSSYYKASHGIRPSGYSEGAAPQKVNTYTIAIDFRIPLSGKDYAILQTDPANSGDAELFVKGNGSIGSDAIGWTDSALVQPGDWYRLSMAVSLGDTLLNLCLALDGDSLLAKNDLALDGDLALSPRDAENALIFCADDNSIDVANLAVWNRRLTPGELRGLRGYEHETGYVPVAAHNKVFNFDGSDSHVLFTHNISNSGLPVRDMTVECWAYIRQEHYWGGYICAAQDNGSYEKGWVLGNYGTAFSFALASVDKAADEGDDNGSMTYLPAMMALDYDAWYHITGTYDGTTMKIFVNGELYNSTTEQYGDILYDPVCPFSLGAYYDENEFFVTDGYLDEFRIWNVALDSAMLQQWMNKEINETHPLYDNLVSYWNFNSISRDTVIDLKGSNNGKLHYMTRDSYVASTSPVGTDGAFVGTKTPTAAGPDGAQIQVAISSTPDSANTLGLYLFGENDGSVVDNEWYPERANARSNFYWGVYESGDVEADVSIYYNQIQDIPAPASLRLLKRENVFSQWEDVTNSALHENGGFHISDETSYGEYAVGWDKSTVGIELPDNKPFTYKLYSNYPNPFNPSTTFSYEIAKDSDVKLTIYNTLGQVVKTVVHIENQQAGKYNVVWSTENLVSGVYFYRIEADDFVDIKKMTLLK